MGILAHVLLFPYYVLVGIYSLVAACVMLSCLAALGMVFLRGAGADVLDRRSAARPG